LFRKKEMTEKERLRLIHELNMINIGRNLRTDGSGGPMMPGGTREWGEAAGVLEPQPPEPAPAPAPVPENEAENVEANIPMPQEVDETEVHVEEGEEYNPESDHEELPGREVPNVEDLVQQPQTDMSKEEAREKLTEMFSGIKDSEEREKLLATIDRRIERFADKLGGLLKWADQKVATVNRQYEESTEVETPPERKFPVINPSTERSVLLEIFAAADEGDPDAKSAIYQSLGDIEDSHPDLAERYRDTFEKSELWSVVENPFANPFYDTSFNKITETPQRGIVNPVQVAPAEIIKEEKPKDINGFAMNDNDDLSLLPSSVFASNDAPVADNMSLLPAGWKADVE
jgi:polyhydroxyalkanoate synthesis regulator phasin